MNLRQLQHASDEELLGLICAEDPDAFRVLYDRHLGWLIVRLGRRCSDGALVDEAVQDTFLAVWKGARSYRGEGAVAAWIWGIAVRRLIDCIRGQRPPGWAMGGSKVEQSAEELVLLEIEHGDLAGAMNRLSPELRAVLRATALDGLTTREAAVLLGIPAGTVKTRLMRARRELREALT
ncbi:RNA polymerase sigma factor [soil metagenome]